MAPSAIKYPYPRATIKAHPTPHHPPSPLRISISFS
jgi:hypothetical protein